ncbi:unnamed protein product [Adineta ricciae]|uniref:Uncharacterized protein n=2 Tax=Adineta ricciae TaxID=249248 RepID=A0A814IES9_ADIRI|nr:unnamed protein product [Adineta ricciae]
MITNFIDQQMTVPDEELLISPTPQTNGERKAASRLPAPQPIRIECQAEQRHFIHTIPVKINGQTKPIRFTVNDTTKPGQYRSEIIVHTNPDTDFYIKKLRIAYHSRDDLAVTPPKTPRSSSRSHSVHAPSHERQRSQPSGKSRSVSFPRSNSQSILHQWIDDICSDEKLLSNDNICFFLKNGEFLARI